jgi:hypothetical protein
MEQKAQVFGQIDVQEFHLCMEGVPRQCLLLPESRATCHKPYRPCTSLQLTNYVLLYCSALVSRDHEYATIHTVPVDDTLQLINRYVTIMFLLRCRIIWPAYSFDCCCYWLFEFFDVLPSW